MAFEASRYAMANKYSIPVESVNQEKEDLRNDNQFTIEEQLLKSLPVYRVYWRNSFLASDYVCQICLRKFYIGDYVASLPCKHKFHYFCIESWIKWVGTYCPEDRLSLVQKFEEEFEERTEDIVEDYTALIGEAAKSLKNLHLTSSKKQCSEETRCQENGDDWYTLSRASYKCNKKSYKEMATDNYRQPKEEKKTEPRTKEPRVSEVKLKSSLSMFSNKPPKTRHENPRSIRDEINCLPSYKSQLKADMNNTNLNLTNIKTCKASKSVPPEKQAVRNLRLNTDERKFPLSGPLDEYFKTINKLKTFEKKPKYTERMNTLSHDMIFEDFTTKAVNSSATTSWLLKRLQPSGGRSYSLDSKR